MTSPQIVSKGIRFMEKGLPKSDQMVSLDKLADMLARAPADIDFRDALLNAQVNADFVINIAREAVENAKAKGTLKKYNLTEDEALILSAYTVQAPKGHLSMYDALNQALRSPHTEANLRPIRDLLVIFLRTLRRLPVVVKDEVYRGMDKNFGQELKADTRLTWWGFSSTSWNANVTNTFIKRTGGSLFILRGPCRGYDLTPFSVYPGESELLLEPETSIRVVAVVKLGKSGSTIVCKVENTQPILREIAPFRYTAQEVKQEIPVEVQDLRTFKLLLLGEFGVGKSSIILRYSSNTFRENGDPADELGRNGYNIQSIRLEEGTVRLQIWDTAGQERHHSITDSFYRDSDGAILVYDITKPETFGRIQFWLGEITRLSRRTDVCCILVGNKSDMEANRQVTRDEAQRFADEKGIPFMETSAKSPSNVNESFDMILSFMMRKLTEPKEGSDTIKVDDSDNSDKSGCC